MKREEKKDSSRPASTGSASNADPAAEDRWKHSGERQYEKGVVDEESEPRLEIGPIENEKESQDV